MITETGRAPWSRAAALPSNAVAWLLSDIRLVYWALLAVVGVLVLAPLGVLLLGTIKPAAALPWDTVGLTLENYQRVFGAAVTYRLLLNTLVYAAGAIALGLSLAAILAWLIERTDLPGRTLVFVALAVALGLPSVLVAMGWSLLISPRIGVANLALRGLLGSDLTEGPLNGYSLGGMIFVTGLVVCPSMFLMLSALLRGMDPALEEGAATSGARPALVARRITVPLLVPGLLAVAMYFTVGTIHHFDIPLVLGLPGGELVLSTRIYVLTQGGTGAPQYGTSATYALVTLGIGLALMYAYVRATRRADRYRVVSGKAYRPRVIRLGRWKYPALTFVWGYLALALGAPLLILLWASLLPFYQTPSLEALGSLSLAAYQQVLQNPRVGRAVLNTVLLIVSSATLCMLLSALVAWTSLRVRGGRLLEGLAFVITAIPSIVIALAVLLLYVRTPIYGTLWILVLGHVTAYLAFGSRTMSAAVLQLGSELEESAAVHGANWFATFRRIVAPLLFPALANGWIWVAAHSARDFTFPLMLTSTDNMVVASLLWEAWRIPNIPGAAAISVMLALTLGVLLGLARGSLIRRVEA